MARDLGLEARGFQLSEEAFCAQRESAKVKDDNNTNTHTPSIHEDLKVIMDQVYPEHDIW